MIASWMFWATGIGVLLYAAGWAVDHALRSLNKPARFAWAIALAAAVVVPAVVSARRQEALQPSLRIMDDVTLDIGTMSIGAPATPADPSFDPRQLNRPLLVAWLLGSSLMLARLFGSAARLVRRRGQWTDATLDGEVVAIAETDGPALAGVLHPVIVVPRWLVDQPPLERALVLRHEVEHRRARDPLLLAAAALLVALVPWNLALWALSRRLRLAVEVDCDARVLSTGADARTYGSMLLAVAERVALGAALSPALLEPPSFLEGRIRAMTLEPRRHPILRAAVAGSAAVAVIVGACGTPHPAPLRPAALRAAEGEPLRHSSPIVMPPASVPVSPASRTPKASLGEASGALGPQRQEPQAVLVERNVAVLARLYPEALRDGGEGGPVWLLLDSAGERLLTVHRGPVALPPHDSTIAAGFGISVANLGTWNYMELHRPGLDVWCVIARVRHGSASTTSREIDLARLKRLVENTYPEAARLGTGDSAVWILIQYFDGRSTYEARRAPLFRPMTSGAVAGFAGVPTDSVISFAVSNYRVNDESPAPMVDVVVAQVRPGTRYNRGWRTFVAPTEDQDSVRQNFEQIRLMLIREIPERFPQVRTAEETRLFFVLDYNYQIIRAERVEAPDVPAQRWGRREPGADWSGAFGYGTGTFGPGWVAAAFSVMPRP